MNLTDKLDINMPHVVHDTIDGETILVNLKNGNYYSFDKFGVVAWDFIIGKGDLVFLVKKISEIFEEKEEKIVTVIKDFIGQLLEEDLLISDNDKQLEIHSDQNEELTEKLKSIMSVFEAPVLNKYSDMQDILLLDPIHDTDEKGWPSGKQDE